MNDISPEASRKSPTRAIFLAILLAFVGGIALAGWALTHWAPAQSLLSAPATTATNSVDATDVTSPPLSTPAAPTQTPAPAVTDAHVATLESRLNEIDRHAAASAAQANRAEDVLIAFAARRSVDRGVALGYLEGQLNSHFGSAQPRAVANIIAASHTPITLDQLRAGLDSVATQGDSTSNTTGWWAKLRANMSGLLTVRKADQPSASPDERLARARLALSTGAVDNALAEIARLPGGAAANSWMANARRYIEAHAALDLLEAAAIMPNENTNAAPAPNNTPSDKGPASL